MAGGLTLWGAGQLLGAQFGKLNPLPENYYLALIRDIAPTPYVSGSEIDEPIEGGYVRATIPNTGVYWEATGQLQTTALATDVEFSAATSAWGIIRYWAICNQAEGGFIYFCGSLESSIDVDTGDTVVLNDGDLTISLGPF